MRAVRSTEDGVVVTEVAAAVPSGDDVRVRVAASGICGSDLHLVGWGALPVTLGHEVAGWLEDGTPVAVEPVRRCGTCDRCLAGDTHLCPTALTVGISVDGGMADEVVVGPECVVPLPDGLDVAILGTYWDELTVAAMPLSLKELDVVGCLAYGHHGGHREVEVAAALLARVPGLADTIITHRFGLDDAPEAFRVAADRGAGAIKVVLEP